MKTFYHVQKDNSNNLNLFRTKVTESSKSNNPMTMSETKQILKIDLFKVYITAVSVTIAAITLLSILKY